MKIKKTFDFPGLNQRIKEARIASGRSVRELAEAAGLSESYWFKVENGEREVVSEYIIRCVESALETDFGLDFYYSQGFLNSEEVEQ